MSSSQNKLSISFIFLTVLIDVVGFGLLIPIMPKLLEQMTGQPTNENSWTGTLLLVSFATMQFLFAPILGELSDRFGRRPILLIALLGLSADYLLHAFAPTLLWLFVGRFIAGITGATHSVANAYVADISTKENKAKNFGLIGAAFGLGFILGPVLGGILGDYHIRLPFFVAAGLALVNFLFGLFVLPESLPKEKRRKIKLSKMLPLGSLIHLMKYKGVGLLILGIFFSQFASQSLPTTWSYFGEEMYNWDPTYIGISLAVVGLLVAIVMAVLVGKFVNMFGSKRTVIIGFVFSFIGMSLFAFAKEPYMLYLFLIPFALGGVAGPTLQGIISNQVPENEQGNLQGAITGLNSVTLIFGTLLAGSLFKFFAEKDTSYYFPGAPYIAAGGLIFIAIIIVRIALPKVPESMPAESEDVSENEEVEEVY